MQRKPKIPLEVTAGKSLTTIGLMAFEDCTNLRKVHLEKGVQEIQRNAFFNCTQLSEINFPEGLLQIMDNALTGCNKLLNITLPFSLQSIQDYLLSVPNRVVKIYNPYLNLNFGSINEDAKGKYKFEPEKAAEGFTIYIHRDSALNIAFTDTYNQITYPEFQIHYFDNDYVQLAPAVPVPLDTVNGVGSPDTNWYDVSKDTFRINNTDQLAGLSELVKTGESFVNKTIILMKDLDLGCYDNWTSIGTLDENHHSISGQTIFSGIFDGNGHKIYNLRTYGTTEYEYGLFGSSNGIIKNLTLLDAQVYGNGYVGILVGYNGNQGTVINCTVNGTIYGYEEVGGLVGFNRGTIKNCIVNANVNGNMSVGGVVGYSSGIVKVCSASGNVNGFKDVGGIAGPSSDMEYMTDNISNTVVTIGAYEGTHEENIPYTGERKDMLSEIFMAMLIILHIYMIASTR